MNIPLTLLDGRRFIFNAANSIQVNLINYSFSGADYDDIAIQTVTGSVVTSGLIFPVRGKQGSTEAMLMEQGKLLMKDKILYLGGDVQLNSSGLLVGLGSPLVYYTIIPDGIQSYEANGSVIYNKLFLKHTIPGSLY